MGFKKWLCKKVFKRHGRMEALLQEIIINQEKIMGTQAEAAVQIDALTGQVQKVFGEIQTKVDVLTVHAAALQQQITDLIDQGQQVDPVLKANIDKLARLVQETDDQIPDADAPIVVEPTDPGTTDTATDATGTDTLSTDGVTAEDTSARSSRRR